MSEIKNCIELIVEIKQKECNPFQNPRKYWKLCCISYCLQDGIMRLFLIIKGKYIPITVEDLGTPRSLTYGLHIPKISRREKESKEIIKACVLLCVFQSMREKATAAASKIFCHDPPPNLMPFLGEYQKDTYKMQFNAFAKN